MASNVADGRVCRSCDAALGGVCAGLAERFDLDPIVVRILAIFITLLTAGLGLIVYMVLWIRLPRGAESTAPYEIMPEHAESRSFGDVDCSTGRAASRSGAKPMGGVSLVARLAIAVGLTLLFLLVAITLSPMLPGTEWWQFWPIALIITGLCLIIIPVPSSYEASWHALGIIVTALAVTLMPISLNVLSWETLSYAFSKAWLLVVFAAIMYIAGVSRKVDAVVVGSAFFIVAFCVFALVACAVPGDAQALVVHMPDGRFLQIAF